MCSPRQRRRPSGHPAAQITGSQGPGAALGQLHAQALQTNNLIAPDDGLSVAPARCFWEGGQAIQRARGTAWPTKAHPLLCTGLSAWTWLTVV